MDELNPVMQDEIETPLTVADVEGILLDIHNRQQIINAAEKKRDASIDFYRQRIDEAKDICEDETAQARDDIALLSLKLERYFDANPPKKRKSLKFAGGSFGYNKASAKFFLDGEELNADSKTLLDFVKNERPDFVRVKESVDWLKLKANLDYDNENVFFSDTGEVFGGVHVQKKFFVRTI